LLQQLKQQRDKVKQYQRRVEQSLERDRLLARKLLVAGRKEFVFFYLSIVALFR
jgi:hypothetical protein